MKRTAIKKPTYEEYKEKLAEKNARAIEKLKTPKVKSKVKKITADQRRSVLVKELRKEMRLYEITESSMYSDPIKNIAWGAFSAYIRLRDYIENKKACICFTCKKKGDNWNSHQAGHYITRGKANTLFNEKNVINQCQQCNNPAMGQGRPRDFAYYLILKHGDGIIQELTLESNKLIKADFFFFYSKAQEYTEKYKILKTHI